MATNGKRTDPQFIVGIVFMLAAVAFAFVKATIGIMLLVGGGVLMANGVAATRKAASSGDVA